MTLTTPRTLAGLVDARAAAAPDAPALVFPDSRATFGELAATTLLAARRLRAAGVQAGDLVGILLETGTQEYVALGLGATRLGAIMVPINARYKARELEYALTHSGLTLLVTSPWFADLLASTAIPAACRVVQIDDPDFAAGADAVTEDEVRAAEARVDPDDGARIIYTSGTTANPKACLHSHAGLLAQGRAVGDRLELTEDDRFWTPLPWFHTAPWASMLATHSRGACFVHGGLFEAGAAVDQIERERCTIIFPSFETIWIAVLTHPRFAEADFSAARLVLNVGVPERLKLMQEMLPHAPQVSLTGSTESCGYLAIGLPTDSLHARTHTSGRVIDGMEARIVDPETGADLPDGTPGELIFRGSSRFKEYYNDPEGTAASIDADGWFHGGDLLRREPDGNLVFVSRLKDMLKVGGENVAAAEIEGHLLTHPAVLIAQVVSAPDARYGEVAAAFVQLREGASATEEELIDACLGQISTFKVPRYVRFVDEWPMSGTKVQKFVLRERIAQELRERGIAEAPRLRPAR